MNNSSEKFAKINKIFSKLFPVIVVFFILVIFIATLWKIPQYQVSHFSSGINDSVKLAELEDKFRSTIAQILGGFVIVIGLYLTHRRVAATEKSLVLTQESQIIDRFTRSIELLGKDELEFKLGGIYGLERTANESEKDYWPIMSILCTYIRKNSPSMVEKNGKFEKNTAPLSMDSQAVLNVLKRPNELRKTKMIVNVFDLNDACLIGANLFEAELIHSNFSKSNLFDVTANDANFSDSYFGHTNLNRSDLMNVNFSGSKFISSNLSESVIVEANFSNTDLSRVDFSFNLNRF